jgi:toxin YoeB
LIEKPRPARRAIFVPKFLADLRYFTEHDRKLTLRLLNLVDAVVRDPFAGIGRPEPLKYLGPDVWSRRLSDEHRLVYRVLDDRIDFLQARYHY